MELKKIIKKLFYNRSKELGNPNAYAYLAIMYQYGLGMDIDYKKALYFINMQQIIIFLIPNQILVSCT